MLVVAQHPVAHRLPVHACRPGCLLPAHAVESVGDRQDAAHHTRVRLGLGQLAKNCRSAVLAYLQRSHDPLPRIIEVRESRTAGLRNPSAATRVGPLVGRYEASKLLSSNGRSSALASIALVAVGLRLRIISP